MRAERASLRNDGSTLGLGSDGCPTIPMSLVMINSTHAGHLNAKFYVYFITSKGGFLNTDMKYLGSLSKERLAGGGHRRAVCLSSRG